MRLTLSPADATQWRAAVAACPWATFFQTPEWYGHAAALLPNHRLTAWSLEVEGTTAILPFFERPLPGSGLWRRSTVDRRGNAAGVYGGWIAPRPLSQEAAAAVVQRFGKGASALRLRLNPFTAQPRPTDLKGFDWEEDHTSILDLGRPLDDIRAGYASGQRRNLRAAEKAGVRCRRATSPADWQAYIDLYAKTLARWGDQATSRYTAGFLLGFAGLSPGVALWLAEREGRLGAAILALQQGSHIVLWHSANDAEEAAHSPFKLLIHEILADAQRRGLRTFDLNPSGRAAGSSQWKALLGAQDLPAPVIRLGPAASPSRPSPAPPPARRGPAAG